MPQERELLRKKLTKEMTIETFSVDPPVEEGVEQTTQSTGVAPLVIMIGMLAIVVMLFSR